MNGLSLHRRIALRRGARLLDEGEYLTETNGIHGQQQEIQENVLTSWASAPKPTKKAQPIIVRDAERHHRLRQQGGDKEDGANQGEHVGQIDVGQHIFQKAAEYCVVRMLLGSKPS
jgi:hypothetical protein